MQAMSAANKTRFHLSDGPAQQERDAKMAAGTTDWSIKAIAWVYNYDAAAAVEAGDLGLPRRMIVQRVRFGSKADMCSATSNVC